MKSRAVSSRGGEEVLKAHAPSWMCAASSCWLCAFCIVQSAWGSDPPGTPSCSLLCVFCGLLLFPWLAILGRQSSVRRRVRPLLFSVGHHFLVLCQVCRQLAAANVLAIGGCVCLCSRGAFSHIPPPPRASAGLELAFTQALRTLFFGAVRFPPSLGDSQHLTIASSTA